MSISDALKGVMGHVDQTAVGLSGSWEGVSAAAAQEALVRYQEAAQVQKNLLDDIAENIQAGGVKYDSADTDGASLMQSAVPDIGL
jgi:WXG100 family type VII secretion target